jgi:hypothetical protein
MARKDRKMGKIKNGTELVLAFGVLALLALVLHQVAPRSDLTTYIVMSLLALLALMIKNRFVSPRKGK